jgi:hypothetical protein
VGVAAGILSRVSDDYIRLIPTDPRWQPARAAAAAATAYAAGLFSRPGSSADQVRHEFFDSVTFVDSGVNTASVRCPSCASALELDQVYDVIGERHPDLTDLDMRVPCCGAVVSLNDLDYDWAVGFARFEITIRNGTRDRYELDDAELTEAAQLLGHPLRQVLAHY